LNRLKTLTAGWRLALAISIASFALTHSPSPAHAMEPVTPPYQILISVPDQKLAVVKDGQLVARFPVSTSRFGIGDQFGSYKTPVGQLRVYDKIGDGLSPGAVIRHRSPTGEVLPVNAPGRDPIVTRVIWLDGLEPQNKNARSRGIYIHGTPEEKTIGKPVSWGCIRMRSEDVIAFYNAIPVGTVVSIIPEKLPHLHRYAPPRNPPPAAPPAPAPEEKPPQPEKPLPAASPATIIVHSATAPENVALAGVRESEITPGNPLPAIAEAPADGSGGAWRAMKGSYLLANLPGSVSVKTDDHARKVEQSEQTTP
jgi:hypothetical protein